MTLPELRHIQPVAVKFVKAYTNGVGRHFRRYVVVGQPDVLPYVVDICTRDRRDGVASLTSAEAKAEAAKRLAKAMWHEQMEADLIAVEKDNT